MTRNQRCKWVGWPLRGGGLTVLVAVELVFALTAGPACAQDSVAVTRVEQLRAMRREKAERLAPPKPPGRVERAVRFVERRLTGRGTGEDLGIFRPLFGDLHEGAGPTAGLRYAPLSGDDVRATVDVRASLKGYRGVDGLLGYDAGPAVAYAYGRYRHMPEEDFYGIGAGTPRADRADYRLDEAIAGLLAGVRPHRRVFMGVHGSFLAMRPGPGDDEDVPDLRERFDAAAVPGRGLDYVVAGGWLAWDTRNLAHTPLFGSRFAPTQRRLRGLSLGARHGVFLAAEAAHHLTTGRARFDFTRVDVELQQLIPIRNGYQSLALRQHGTFTFTAVDHAVPFYLLPALGGAYTIRGYDAFRFRDRHAVLFTAEYRWQAWIFLDLALFVDAGQVFHDVDALGRDGLAVGYGIGFRAHTRAGVVARFDVARSEEGVVYILKLGTLL